MYQLLRTNISLTGNAMLCCELNRINGETSITSLSLRPLTIEDSDVKIDIPTVYHGDNIMTYSEALSQLYSKYRDKFYNPPVDKRFLSYNPFTPMSAKDTFVTGFNLDSCRGVRRISKKRFGKSFLATIPIWIDSEFDITPRDTEICIEASEGERSYLIKPISGIKPISKSSNPNAISLYTFIMSSIRGIAGVDNDYNANKCNRIIYIPTPSDNMGDSDSIIRGWSVESGGLVEVRSDLHNRLMSGALTMYQFDKMICDEFANKKVVIPNIINIGILFDWEDIIDSNIDTNSAVINAYMGTLPIVDMEFNHEYVNSKRYGDIIDNVDVLRLTNEGRSATFSHQYKEFSHPQVSQWTLTESNDDYIFNIHPGFDAYSTRYGMDINSLDKDKHAYTWLDGDMCIQDSTSTVMKYTSRLGGAPYYAFINNGVRYMINKKSLEAKIHTTNSRFEIKEGSVITFKFVESSTPEVSVTASDTGTHSSVQIEVSGQDMFSPSLSLMSVFYPMNPSNPYHELLDYFQIVPPTKVITHEMISSRRSQGDSGLYNIYSYPSPQPIPLCRYFGWIKPRMVKLVDGKRKDANLFYKIVNRDGQVGNIGRLRNGFNSIKDIDPAKAPDVIRSISPIEYKWFNGSLIHNFKDISMRDVDYNDSIDDYTGDGMSLYAKTIVYNDEYMCEHIADGDGYRDMYSFDLTLK